MSQNIPSDSDEQTGQLGQSLSGLDFPADKSAIVAFARTNQLNAEMLAVIMELPDRQYQDLRDVLDHFAGGTERIESEHEPTT